MRNDSKDKECGYVEYVHEYIRTVSQWDNGAAVAMRNRSPRIDEEKR